MVESKSRTSRRSVLKALLLGPPAASLSATQGIAEAQPSPSVPPQGACTLFPEQVEGPFYFDPKLVRSDITEGRPGQPIKLALKVIELGSCSPIAKARVDVWHADASGLYSGYARQGDDGDISTKGSTYLRGTQVTTDDGTAAFQTIYPGWYPGRTPHIHVKVYLDEKTLATGQIYFPDDLSARIYQSFAPYKARPTADTTNETDFIFRHDLRKGGGIVFLIDGSGELPVATLVIAVDRSGHAARNSRGWGEAIKERLGL